jgi:hypothetical protein
LHYDIIALGIVKELSTGWDMLTMLLVAQFEFLFPIYQQSLRTIAAFIGLHYE